MPTPLLPLSRHLRISTPFDTYITVDHDRQNNLPAYLEAQLRYRLMNRIKAQLLEFLKVRPSLS